MADDEQSSVLKVLVELVDKITEPLSAIHESFEEFESGIWSLTQSFASAFLGYEMFEKLIEPASEFQEAQTRLALATQFSSEQLKQFKEQAEYLSQTFPSDLEDVTQAQTNLYQTFRDTKTTLAATEQADKLATALGIKASAAANILASAYLNLAPRGSDVNKEMGSFADKLTILNTRFPMGTQNVTRMARDFARLGASAKTYGLDINQVFALLGELNRLHVAGQQGAGIFAQQLIHTMAAVDTHGIPTLQKYGLQIVKTTHGNLNLIKTLENMSKMNPAALKALEAQLPGEAQSISSLVDHIGDLTSAYYQMDKSAGAADQATKKQQETFQNREKAFENSLQNVKDLYGSLALPALTKLMVQLTKLITVAENFTDTHPKIAQGIADFLGLAAAAVMLFGMVGFLGKAFVFLTEGMSHIVGLINVLKVGWAMMGDAFAAVSLIIEGGIGSIGAALGVLFESNPVGWTLTLLAGVAMIGYEVYKHWDSIKHVIVEVVQAIQRAIHYVEGLPDFQKLVGAAKGFASGSFQAMVQGWESGGASAIGPSGSGGGQTNLHYMEGAQITVQGGSNPNEMKYNLEQALSGHADDLLSKVDEQRRRENRLTFRDTTAASTVNGY